MSTKIRCTNGTSASSFVLHGGVHYGKSLIFDIVNNFVASKIIQVLLLRAELIIR